ncbi:HIR complex subunit [Sporothrix epigloea]|uniref:Protein HIR n=1 Tax=Sporothrix epigloea TaxID=1892477 RepID=A0ABP0DIM9_9PEZI
MHLIKPSWLSHSGEQKDFEVYSCHVSPDGRRLATAGGDGHVRVWSTEAIYHSNSPSSSAPRQLCHMSHHLGTVHSVRFSPNGRYLASGADDKIICIYRLDASAPAVSSSFGSTEPPPVENWKTYKRLIGHENDVQDLAWSHDSSILVSVGLDSKVVVWSGHTFERLKTISVHQSHVKGVTFDPANKFFATASDDRTMKIFKFTPPPPNATQHDLLNNFVLETTISTPFHSSPLTTYFRRCSWSPDGNHIAAPNAVNGPVSSVAIIERTSWDSEINLIGHEGPTEVCMFSPRLFYNKKPTDANNGGTNGITNGSANGSSSSSRREAESLVTVIASAGQDKTLSIWNTNTSRPLVILQDIASKSISDLAWTPDGQAVFASSLDGSIVVAKFEEGELGWAARPEETDKALQKFSASRKGMGIAEDVDGLHLEEHSKAGELRGAESRMGALMGDAQTPAKKDGSGVSTPAANGAKGKATADNVGEANGTGEKDKDKEASATPAAVPAAPPQTVEEETAEKRAERIQTLKSRVTITKDGRKRVAPLLVSSSGTGQSSLPQSQLVGATSAGKPSQVDTPQTILDLSRPEEGLPKGGIASLLLGTKRKAAVALDGDEDAALEPAAKRLTGLTGAAGVAPSGPTPILINGIDGTEPATLQPAPRGVVPTPEFIRPAVINPSLTVSQVRLGIPKVRAHILRPLEKGVLLGESTADEAARIAENLIFEARNPELHRDPSHITVTKRGDLVWQDFLPRAVLLVAGNKFFWAAACEDGTIYIWTPAGRRLVNAMILEAQPVILECREHWLLCISAVGLAHVWNVQTMQSPHPPVSLAAILDIAIHPLQQHAATAGPGITSAHLNSNGHIVVTLSNGDGYYYAPNLYSWQRLSESWWAVGSQYWNSNDSSISALQTTAVGPITAADVAANGRSTVAAYLGSDLPSSGSPATAAAATTGTSLATVSSGIIPFLERHTTNEFLLKGRAYTLQRLVKTLLARDGFEGFEASVSIAHLENRIAGALQLGSRDEFRLYLFMYAKRLGTEGLRGKVEELLNSLLGDVLQPSEPAGRADAAVPFGWASRTGDLCGWDRKELLKGVVMILGKYRELQRLTVQYARVLELAQEDEDGHSAGDSMVVEA